MPVDFPRRLALIGLLCAAFFAFISLVLGGLVHDAMPALASLVALWLLGVVTWPRQRPSGWDAWIAPTLVVAMGLTSLAAACIICLSTGPYAGRTDFQGLTALGLGLLGGSCTQRLGLLMDEMRAWPKATDTQAPGAA